MKTLEVLQANVERELEARKWKQRDLAEKIDMSASQLSRALLGHNSPSLDILERIAAGLGITVSALLRAPEETTDHALRACHARVGRALEEWEKLARRLEQAASKDDRDKKNR